MIKMRGKILPILAFGLASAIGSNAAAATYECSNSQWKTILRAPDFTERLGALASIGTYSTPNSGGERAGSQLTPQEWVSGFQRRAPDVSEVKVDTDEGALKITLDRGGNMTIKSPYFSSLDLYLSTVCSSK